MPLQTEFLPLKGLQSFMQHFKAVITKVKKHPEVPGFIFTLYDECKTMYREVGQQLEQEFGEKLFHTYPEQYSTDKSGSPVRIFSVLINMRMKQKNIRNLKKCLS